MSPELFDTVQYSGKNKKNKITTNKHKIFPDYQQYVFCIDIFPPNFYLHPKYKL